MRTGAAKMSLESAVYVDVDYSPTTATGAFFFGSGTVPNEKDVCPPGGAKTLLVGRLTR